MLAVHQYHRGVEEWAVAKSEERFLSEFRYIQIKLHRKSKKRRSRGRETKKLGQFQHIRPILLAILWPLKKFGENSKT